MPDFGTMVVDWEERINPDRLRRERLAKAKLALQKSDADALLVFRAEDARYITGHRSHLGPVPWLGLVVVFLPKGGEPIVYTMDAEHATSRMPWIPKNNIRSLLYGIIEGNEAAIRKWAEENKTTLGSARKIGIDIWTPDMTKAFKAAMPNTEFVNGEAILMEAKKIKTVDEIECLRTVASITEAGFQAALDVLKPGIRECEVLAEAWRAMTRLGSEWTQCSNIVTSGPYTAPYRRFTSDRIIRKGDLVIVDIGGNFNGYWGDETRTFVCGDVMPTKEQIDLHQEAYDTLFGAISLAKPGASTAEVYNALQNKNSFGLSLGHGSGVNPWEAPWFTGASGTSPEKLAPGMYFSLEPYAGKVGVGGIRLENNVLVTAGGPEIISTFPFDDRLLRNIHPLDKTTGRASSYPRRA